MQIDEAPREITCDTEEVMTTKLQSRPMAYTPSTAAPPRDTDDVRDRFRRALADTLGLQPFGLPTAWAPSVEVVENEKSYTVTAELPGLEKDDVQVRFDDGMLTIQGEKREERREEDPKRQYHLFERTYGSFARTFTFPSMVDDGALAAKFKAGVLEVTLPKNSNAKPRGKAIRISG